ncbi:hypothetical protein [Streptomyces sp. NPDC020996]
MRTRAIGAGALGATARSAVTVPAAHIDGESGDTTAIEVVVDGDGHSDVR